MVGSSFTSPAESNYAPIEGECLGVANALKKTRYYTQGCEKLLIGVDHKPLLGVLIDKSLESIDNPRLNFHVPRLVEGLLTIRSKVAKGLRAQIPAVHTHFCFQSLKTYLDETEFSRFEIFSRGLNFCSTSTDKCTQCQRHCVSRSFLWDKKDSQSVAG